MPPVALGPGGLLDATLADLGTGASWDSVHRVRPRVALTCRACGGSMHAEVSPRGSRFFAHDVARSDCPLNGETPDHRLLKSAIGRPSVPRAGMPRSRPPDPTGAGAPTCWRPHPVAAAGWCGRPN